MIKNIEDEKDEQKFLLQIKSFLESIPDEERRRIPEAFSKNVINRIYPVMNELNFSEEVQEHLIWAYFKNKLDEESLNEHLLFEILNKYKEKKLLAIESVIITAIKEDKVSISQLDHLREFFNDQGLLSEKAFLKESLSLQVRLKSKNGQKLNRKEVEELYAREAFRTLQSMLQEEKVDPEALKIFEHPKAGEKNKRLKASLFDEAQKLLQKYRSDES